MTESPLPPILKTCLGQLSVNQAVTLLRTLDTRSPWVPKTEAEWIPILSGLRWHGINRDVPSQSSLEWLLDQAPSLLWERNNAHNEPFGCTMVNSVIEAIDWGRVREQTPEERAQHEATLLRLIDSMPAIHERTLERWLNHLSSIGSLSVLAHLAHKFTVPVNDIDWSSSLATTDNHEVWPWFLEQGGDARRATALSSSRDMSAPLWVASCWNRSGDEISACEAWGRQHDPEGTRLLDALRQERVLIDLIHKAHKGKPEELENMVSTLPDGWATHLPVSDTPLLHEVLARAPSLTVAWEAGKKPPPIDWTLCDTHGNTVWAALWRNSLSQPDDKKDSKKNLVWPAALKSLLRKAGVWSCNHHGQGVLTQADPANLVQRWRMAPQDGFVTDKMLTAIRANPEIAWGHATEHQATWAQGVSERLFTDRRNARPGARELLRLAVEHPNPSEVTPALRGLWLATALWLEQSYDEPVKVSQETLQEWVVAGPWLLPEKALEKLNQTHGFTEKMAEWTAIQERHLLNDILPQGSSTRTKIRL